MRKLIFTLSLLLSFSFACDQPHEQVGDYKIGCPFKVDKSFNLSDTSYIGNKKIYSYVKDIANDATFSGEEVVLVDGSIEGVAFSLKDGIPLGLAQSILERWGEPASSDGLSSMMGLSDDTKVIIPDNQVVAAVIITPEMIIYSSKKIIDIVLEEENKIDYSRY